MKSIRIATRNAGKLREFRQMLEPLGYEVKGIDDLPDLVIDENGASFEANARAKAAAVMRATGEPAVGDDSGLCVDALGGAPGVHSARYAGVEGLDQDAANRDKLLKELADVRDPKRTARFVCALALSVPGERPRLFGGILEGRVAYAERGTNGFGYDPIFIPPRASRTVAEMEPEEKNSLSHRGRALGALVEYLHNPSSEREGGKRTMARNVAVTLAALATLLVLGALGYVGWQMPAAGPERMEIQPDVVGVRAGAANAYIVRRGDGVVLVDAGSDPQGTAILAELGRDGLGTANVAAILVTHAHPDHFAAAALFPQAVVYVGEADHLVLRGQGSLAGPLPRLAGRLMPAPPKVAAARSVLPGSLLTLAGMQFDVIATPGHTPGSVMYLHEGVLFSGDSLIIAGSEVTTPPWFFSASAKDNRRSLLRLAEAPFTAIATGHGGAALDGRQRYERWLAAAAPR